VKKNITFRVLGVLLLLPPALAAAQTYPARQVTVVAALAPGTGLDVITRMYAARLTQSLGRPVIVENKPGGSQIVAMQALLAAPADGHTLLVATSAAMALNASMFKTLPYSPQKDVTPISLYLKSPYILVVNPKVPAQNVAELIQYARANPGKLNYSSINAGGVTRLAMEIMNTRFGINSVNVPYKDTGRSIADIASGEIQLAFVEAGASQALIHDGALRALAVSSQTRLSSLPDVPPISEAASAPDFEAVSWHVLLTRAGTPQPVVSRLHEEMKRIMTDAEIQNRMKAIGLIPMNSPSVEGIQKYMGDEEAKWGAVIRKLGLAGSQ